MLIKDNAIAYEMGGRVGLLSSCCLGHALDPTPPRRPPPQKSRGVRVGVPSRGVCFLGKHDLKHAVVFGSAFLARALVFWEKHDLKKPWCFGSAFLAGALVFWTNHDMKHAVVFGSAFLAGAFGFSRLFEVDKTRRGD